MAITTNKSVTLKSSATGGTFTLNAKFTENSVDYANNTSNITVTATLSKGTGSFDGTGGTLYIDWYDNKSGSLTQKASKSITSLMSGSNSVSSTFNAEHNSDGTLSGYARARWSRGSSTYAPSSGNVSTNTTALTSIPRNATFNLVSESYGTNQYKNCILNTTFNLNVNNSNYVNKLYYSWNGHNNLLISDNVNSNFLVWYNGEGGNETGQNFVFPYTFKDIANTLTTATETTISFHLKTFSGETQIGDTQTIDYTYKIGDTDPSYNGSISLSTTDTTLTGSNQIFINGVSNVIMQFNNITMDAGSVKNYTFVGNGENVTQTSNSYTFTSKANSLNNEFIGYVNTTRGNTFKLSNKYLSDYTIKDYTRPAITTFTTKRNDTMSTTVTATIGGSYWNKSFGSQTNTLLSVKITMTPSSGNSTTKTITPTYSGANFSGSITFTLPTTDDATFLLSIQDRVGTYTQQSNCSKSVSIFDFGDDYFGFNTDLYMGSKQIKNLATPTANTDGATKKYVDDKATSTLNSAKTYADGKETSAKTYTDNELKKEGQFNNGINETQSYYEIGDLLICMGKKTYSVSANSYATSTITFPKEFGSVPYCYCSFQNNTTNTNYGYADCHLVSQTTTGATMQVVSHATASITPAVSWLAIGQRKSS